MDLRQRCGGFPMAEVQVYVRLLQLLVIRKLFFCSWTSAGCAKNALEQEVNAKICSSLGPAQKDLEWMFSLPSENWDFR